MRNCTDGIPAALPVSETTVGPLGLPTATYVRTLVTHRCTDRTADKSSTTPATHATTATSVAACHGGAHSPDSAQQHAISQLNQRYSTQRFPNRPTQTSYSRTQQAFSNLHEPHDIISCSYNQLSPSHHGNNKPLQASRQAGRFTWRIHRFCSANTCTQVLTRPSPTQEYLSSITYYSSQL